MSLLKLNRIKVIRQGKTENIRGKIVVGEKQTLEVEGTLQPEKDLTLIREVFGSHIEAAIKVFSKSRLLTVEDMNGADVIEWDERRWEVSNCRAYTDIIPHYKSIAILIKDEK